MIKAKDLIKKVAQAYNEKWGYIWGKSGQVWTKAAQDAATREMTVKYGSKWIGKRVADCSGLLAWAFKELGGYIYHGSNTQYDKYTSSRGTLSNGKRSDGKPILPGTAVFLRESNGKRGHVGLYIGDGQVIEAKGTRYGVVMSDLGHWEDWGELKDVDYSEVDGNQPEPAPEPVPLTGEAVVDVPNDGTVNVRLRPSTGSKLMRTLPEGATVQVIADDGTWSKVLVEGYIMSRFLKKGGA